MRLVTMGGAPIMQQLHLEERLLRRTSDNWCVVNDGTAPPTIVMGVSGYVLFVLVSNLPLLAHACLVEFGLFTWFPCADNRKVSELVEIQPVLQDRVPVIRRFSGGGTVIVDQGTVFVTFICNKTAVAGLQPFPRDIMTWTGQLYGKVFRGFGEFHLRENGMSK
jgi:lipoate-protein ligase A